MKRYDWRQGEYYLESLDMTPAAVDLARLNTGAAPFLDNHARDTMANRLGAVLPGSARIRRRQRHCNGGPIHQQVG
ncbi:hypothetical protein N8D56_19765 [Devosia sp. A8/3-2]|nr:hypothetical protein N8D56_19765 [Devosia sp. A8/3-2]